MGVGGFIHNAYNIYNKPEIQIPLNTISIGYNLYKIGELATHERCYICNKLYYPENGKNRCEECERKFFYEYFNNNYNWNILNDIN